MAETSSDLIFFPSAPEYAEYFAGADALGGVIDHETLFMLQMKLQSGISGLLHLTKNLQDIGDSGVMYPSAGGLGGVVYSVPVCGKTIHNLGSHLLNYEMPFFAGEAGSDRSIKTAVLLPIEEPRFGLVDYLAFGKDYQETYATSEYLQRAIRPEDLAPLVARNQRIIIELKQHLSHMDADYSHSFKAFLTESPLV